MPYQINKHIFISATKKRFILWMVALFSSYLLYYLIDPFSAIWSLYINDPLGEGLESFLWMIGFSIINVEVCLFVDHKLDYYLPWSYESKKRIITQTALQVLGSVFIILIIDIFFTLIYERVMPDDYPKAITWIAQCVANTILVSLLISGMNSVDFLLETWKKTTLEAAELKLQAAEHKQAATEAELLALKLQINPHFIFNNLSVLSEIILRDQKLGYEYAENFSKVYRYLLINSKKNIIAVEEELKFLDAYIFMTQKRLENGVIFKVDMDENCKYKEIPPMTLQFLVENAIKHNQTSKQHPLVISIRTINTNEIQVSNTLIPLINKTTTSTGVGLSNIEQRFELLNFPKPQIEITPSSYTVKIPLL